ncbi:MAG: FAD-binding protein [Desulfovibrionaceae bacterium]|jgi:D-lactate dehydrogenase (cytochrome)/glycolate oxidase|nr:FAD-binding protein [Desulfovibrionaceae bacterium]
MTHDTLSTAQATFLKDLFPGDALLLTAEEMALFSADASRIQGTMPLAVVRPESVEQVSRLLAWAQAETMPIYPRARATNVVGACVPGRPGVVVSTLRMNRVLEVSRDDFVVVTEPGVVTAQLQKRVEADGLFYPPDPASLKISTIGGNVSTCAGGMRAVKYGVTRDYVLGCEAVLPGGEIIHPGGRTHKNVVGLDILRLLVGAEGTLAFITKLILKLLPRPEATASLLAGYGSLKGCMDAARAVFDAGVLPTAMEFLARETLDCLRGAGPVPWPEETEAALLFRLDGARGAMPAELERLTTVIAGTAPSLLLKGLGAAEEEPLWDIRRSINPASFHVAPDKISDDIAVPRGAVAPAVEGIRAIGKRRRLTILTFGHLGDGNIHVNIMHHGADPDEHARAVAAKEEVLDLVLSLGGTLSGEHGVGLTKVPYIRRQLEARQIDLMLAMKKAFDPNEIMNPGKIF